jgi:hypothetical protein
MAVTMRPSALPTVARASRQATLMRNLTAAEFMFLAG